MTRIVCSCLLMSLMLVCRAKAADPPKRTTLSDSTIRFEVPKKPYLILKRAGVEAVIVNNDAVNDDVLKDHHAGYSGIGSLKGTGRNENYFFPTVAGLNFEHIIDGTNQDRKILFEPRNSPMELRRIDEHTAELHQPPTPHYGLESCLRYQMLDDGAIEMTVECIARKQSFKNGYINLFWASYINQPESLDIHFKGHGEKEGADKTRWIRGVTPSHGTLSTHPAHDDERVFKHDDPFPLTLVFNLSKYRYREPWYFGINGGVAYVQMFRAQDRVRLTQSPSGGGKGNPAWDSQVFFPDYEVAKRYQLVMRAMLVKYESPEQVEKATAKHRRALAEQ